MKERLARIGVFYDGNYFLHVSNYYNYDHPRKRRLSLSWLHEFIRNQVAQEEGEEAHLCQIVDAHYFRGRLNTPEAIQRADTLYWDRVFDDILMSVGIPPYYLLLKTVFGRREEKCIDVWLALEMQEEGEVLTREVFSIKNGYGFVKYPPNNLFFHYTSVIGGDFNEHAMTQNKDVRSYRTLKTDAKYLYCYNIR